MRTGFRMMPTLPRSPILNTAGLPQHGWKAGISGGAAPVQRPLQPAPGIRRPTPGLSPSFPHRVVRVSNPAVGRPDGSIVHNLGVGLYSAPAVLAPVRVVLSRFFLAQRAVRPTYSHTASSPAARLIRDSFAVREHLPSPAIAPVCPCHVGIAGIRLTCPDRQTLQAAPGQM